MFLRFPVRFAHLAVAVGLSASLSGCCIADSIRDRPLISSMGILQSRKEYERRFAEQNNSTVQTQPTNVSAGPSR